MKIIPILHFLFIANIAFSQVSKSIVVEHFTNTRCSICANKNPGFYTNLDAQQDVLHITFHPSSPYSTCLFSTQNKVENDARANYYGVFGSTPQLVINGEKISPSADFSASALFDNFQNETSPISINIRQYKYGQDSIKAQVILKVVAANTLPAQRLFIGLAEKEVNYAAPNGESLHRDVFRKTMVEIEGRAITLPSIVGDSIVVEATVQHNAAQWNMNQLFALAILQNESDKKVTQSATASINDFNGPNSVEEFETQKLLVYPNPAKDFIVLEGAPNQSITGSVFNISGQKVATIAPSIEKATININTLSPGIYLLEVNGKWYKMAKD